MGDPVLAPMPGIVVRTLARGARIEHLLEPWRQSACCTSSPASWSAVWAGPSRRQCRNDDRLLAERGRDRIDDLGVDARCLGLGPDDQTSPPGGTRPVGSTERGQQLEHGVVAQSVVDRAFQRGMDLGQQPAGS
jgi:hypothetical protein